MTPKEKAKDLFVKFVRFTPAEEVYERPYAKQCALITVSEVIFYHPISTEPDEREVAFHKYWQEVKEEIELL